MTTWRKSILYAMGNDDSFENVVYNTMTEAEMDKEFDNGFGGTEGIEFALWTKQYVYFPIQYDGSEWVERVSRDPDGFPISHKGGGG